ncbi:MAG: (d)CMP kinase [Desulfobacterales bacterium]|nr:(d)CMP kinase [Desulfobacterales bacterium]
MVTPSTKQHFIIAIDGPSGAGKSTAAKLLAKRLRYPYIDTGAMYRAVALKAKEKGVRVEDESALARLASSLRIAFVGGNAEGRVLCNGEDITEMIRSPDISLLASDISTKASVRKILVGMQRKMGGEGGVVLEGRDIGTVVFPNAEVKFYLDADPKERAQRRFEELARKGIPVSFAETLEEVMQRDRNDTSRSVSPLRKAQDAIVIDSTGLSVEEVVERMLQSIREREK